jgi:hypothetical protein
MDKIREKFERERDADVALIRADSAIAEAAQLTTCPELAKSIEKLRDEVDYLSILVWERKNEFLSEIRKKEREEMSKGVKEFAENP